MSAPGAAADARRRAVQAAAWAARRPHHAAIAAVGLGLACAQAPAVAAVAGAMLAFAVALARRLTLTALIGAGVVVGLIGGTARLQQIDAVAARAHPGTELRATATLLERPRRSRFESSAAVEIASGPAAGARVLVRAGADVRWPRGADPGSELRVAGLVSRPERRPGQRLDWPSYLRRRGIAAELELESVGATGRRRGGLAGGLDAWRRRGEVALDSGMSRERGAVARGMVLGEDDAIDPLLRDDFRRSGLAHVLAVSGQNVMLLCALAAPLLGAVGLGRRGRIVASLGLIAVYVPLAGAGPSLQRAGVMGAAGLVALAAGRPASRWYALLVAAAATLALNPRVAGDPGWQLSFAAVVGILLLTPPIRRALRALPGPLAEGVAITLAATAATAPLLAHHFGALSLVGVVANVVALPLVAPIMWLGMLQVAAGIAGLQGLAAPIGRLNGLLIGWLDALVGYFGALPGSRVRVGLGSPAAVVGAYAAMAACALALRSLSRRTEARRLEAAAAWRRAGRRRQAAIGAAVAASIAVAWTRLTGVPPPPEKLTVSFLDVGQGDATLIQDGPGAAVLFDGGPPEARVAHLLRGAGVRRLTLVVATHMSRDHHGGLPEVLRRFPVGALVDGGDGTLDPTFRAMLALARARGARVIEPRAGELLRAGRLAIRVLGPPPRAPGPPLDDPNPRAIAAVVSEGWFDLFLSGDAEAPAVLAYPLPRVDAMKVSHHGSADPELPALLRRLAPRVAAIEVGRRNRYGHPAPSTLAALRRAVPRVYRTDRDGTVKLTVDGARMRVETGG